MGERADTAFKTTGSKWLLAVSEYLGFPLDQVGGSVHESQNNEDISELINSIPQALLCYEWHTVMTVGYRLQVCHLLERRAVIPLLSSTPTLQFIIAMMCRLNDVGVSPKWHLETEDLHAK